MSFKETKVRRTLMKMPRRGFLMPYNVTFLYAEDWVQHPEMAEAQTTFITLMIDGEEIPKPLEKLVTGTGVKMSTLRPCVRYAQDRAAEILITMTELELECERLGYKELHGQRYEVTRGVIEDNTNVPRAQHIGDETWLANANPKELLRETVDAIYERFYMERVADNMEQFILRNQVSAWRKTLGIDVVYQKPERREEDTSKALVKYTGGRAGKGGRGGGTGGRTEGGSFRGWK